jgi:FAD/FMN-containing dehydrogenase/Fe-S oxidoreductase
MTHEARRFPPLRFDHSERSVREQVEHTDRIQSLNVDAAALASALRRELRGEVRFDDGSRALYSTDASNYRQVPIGVVLPRDRDDVVTAVALARRYGAPILARGAGTSLAGQCCNVAVILDFSKYMNGIVALDPAARHARVEPGIILDDLRNAAEKHGLTFGPDPATHSHCTLGGMIGNNSCGVHGLMAGKTDDNIDELEVLTYDGVVMRVGATSEEQFEQIVREGGRRGEIYAGMKRIRDRYAEQIRTKFPEIPRRVSGYNLPELLPERGFNVARALVGSESTCVVVVEAKCRLVASPPVRTLVVLGYDDIYIAADHVPRILEFGPIGLEGVDDRLVRDAEAKNLNPAGIALLPPESRGWLLAEFGGATREEANASAQRLIDALAREPHAPRAVLYDDAHRQHHVWLVRESGLGATAYNPRTGMRTWEGWEDAAVAPEKLGGYLRDLRKLLERYEYIGDLYGHFGQGCVHTRTNFDLETAGGIRKYREFIEEAADLVVAYGGSFSGEHGDGQSRGALLPKMFGEELMQAFREFKSLWDPEWKMNPGKLITPYEPTENLRLGADYNPWSPATHFTFPEDQGRFDHALLRCVGVGKCRRMDSGTMCPSFMATREEEHSTRGRARLLFEMMQGETIADSWQNETVKESLDLCLSCKGCKGDCPVHVDMATYKAEFLAHYYEKKPRPLAAYTMGWIHIWSRFASLAPGLANLLMANPLAKALGGVARQRRMPRYAAETFFERFRRRGSEGSSARSGRRVILWVDTFNNHFSPDTAMAAVEVLEAAGYHVTLSREGLCCGRPLYDWGFLGMAKKQLREILDALAPALDGGVPVIGLEPSCVSVFRDELTNLFPNDPDAKKLAAAAMTLSEFLDRENVPLPRLERKALVQPHCHHGAIMKFDAEERVLRRIGLEVERPDAGCCGMAGAFGFEEKHYEISMRIGERVLIPRVQQASPDTLIVANGFSCREQIAQTTDRHALHLAQVLQIALRGTSRGELPERGVIEERPLVPRLGRMLGIAAAAAGVLALLGVGRRRRRKKRNDSGQS